MGTRHLNWILTGPWFAMRAGCKAPSAPSYTWRYPSLGRWRLHGGSKSPGSDWKPLQYTANDPRWESNINVWFPFMYSQKWNCYFQNRIIMFCLPVPTLIYLWDIYIFPGSVCLFCCRGICGPIQGMYINAHRHMNVEIGTEAAQFTEKEHINGIFFAV